MARIYCSANATVATNIADEVVSFLGTHFGPHAVLDSRNVDRGKNSEAWIRSLISESDVLVTMLDEQWFEAGNDGLRPLDNASNRSRLEIECALGSNVPVVPLLIAPARMSSNLKLPRSIESLSRCESICVYPGLGFSVSLLGMLDLIFPLVSDSTFEESGTLSNIWSSASAVQTQIEHPPTVNHPHTQPDQPAFLPLIPTLDPPRSSVDEVRPASNHRDTLRENPLLAEANLRLLRSGLAVAAILLGGVWLAKNQFGSTSDQTISTTNVDDSLSRLPSDGSSVAETWQQADRLRLEKEISVLRSRKEVPRKTRIENSQTAETLGSPDYSNFTILSDDRYWDLRGWVDRSIHPDTDSSIMLTHRLRVAKISPASEIRFEARTDGDDLYIESLSNPESSYEVVSKTTKFVGNRSTKVAHIATDVSRYEIGEEFQLVHRISFWNSMQDPTDRWLGAIAYPHIDRLRIYVLMPNNQPFKDMKLMKSPSFRDKSSPYDRPVRLLNDDDKMSLLWEIPTPENSNVYMILLDW